MDMLVSDNHAIKYLNTFVSMISQVNYIKVFSIVTYVVHCMSLFDNNNYNIMYSSI